MLAIETQALTRRFASGHGVQALDLAVPTGSVYGFLGPNGAGKTTTIRLLLSLLHPDAGEIRLFGEPMTRQSRAPLREVGSMVESPSLYPHLSGYENLEVTRRLLGLPAGRIEEVLHVVGLERDAGRRVRVYSLGMRQRLGIALALLGKPRLLVLDEPSNGLDPAGIIELRTLLQHMAGELGITVFVSSHLLSEVEQMASHVGVLHQGRLRFQGTPGALRERYGDPLVIRCSDGDAVCTMLAAMGEAAQRVDRNTVHIQLPQRPDYEINRWLVTHGHDVHALGRSPRSLETLFFEMTGRDAA